MHAKCHSIHNYHSVWKAAFTKQLHQRQLFIGQHETCHMRRESLHRSVNLVLNSSKNRTVLLIKKLRHCRRQSKQYTYHHIVIKMSSVICTKLENCP